MMFELRIAFQCQRRFCRRPGNAHRHGIVIDLILRLNIEHGLDFFAADQIDAAARQIESPALKSDPAAHGLDQTGDDRFAAGRLRHIDIAGQFNVGVAVPHPQIIGNMDVQIHRRAPHQAGVGLLVVVVGRICLLVRV